MNNGFGVFAACLSVLFSGGVLLALDPPVILDPPVVMDVLSKDGAQSDIHVAYTEAVAELINKTYQGKPVRIIPGGTALALLKTEVDTGRVPGLKDSFAEIFADGIHLTPKGRYLISLVHDACLFRESPEGKASALTTGLTPEQVAIFQRLAWQAVQQYKWAGLAAPR